MSFLPAIPLSGFPADEGVGGVAVNLGGTLLASVVSDQDCVHMYSVVDPTADAVVVGAATSSLSQLNYPNVACFVHRNGIDTLLICDYYNCVVEVTASGVFLRAIARMRGNCWGIAYCVASDVIAVSLGLDGAVVLLQYESGAVKPEVTIGSGSSGLNDGQLHCPTGVAFTTDGRHLLVADWGNHRVSKFSVASGAFIAHVATKAANGISFPRDVLQCEDGSIVVAQDSLVIVGENGGTVQNIIIPRQSGGASIPRSLAYSSSFGLVVKTNEGQVFLLRDAWIISSRCAWLSALSCC
jgi:hypothetical protein